MKKRVLWELPEKKLFHLLLGDFEKFQSLRRDTLWEPSTFATEVKFKNSVALVPLQNFLHSLHSLLSIQGLI